MIASPTSPNAARAALSHLQCLLLGLLLCGGFVSGLPRAQEGDAGKEPVADEVPDPLERTPIRGERGVEVRSELVPAGGREAPKTVWFVHVYPDRSRLNVESTLDDPFDARRILRFGGNVRRIDPRQRESLDLRGPELARELAHLELRRALFTWPVGLDWERSEDESTARVALLHAANHPIALGTVVATLDAEGRPARVRFDDPEGRTQETLVVEHWHASGFPEVVHHERGGQRTGTETVWRAQRKPAFHDSFFTPPDRRQLRADFTQRVFRPMDLVAATIRPIPLPKGTSWQDARAERERVAEEVAEGLADTVHRLDPRAAFSIDWTGQPTAILLRLRRVAADPPAGWTTLTERPGIGLILPQLSLLDQTRLSTLRRGVPEDAKPGVPYVLLDTRPGI